jgi:uncharacterized protein (DUF1778 family)
LSQSGGKNEKIEGGRRVTITLRLSPRVIEMIKYAATSTGKRYGEIVEEAVLDRYQHLVNPTRVTRRREAVTI